MFREYVQDFSSGQSVQTLNEDIVQDESNGSQFICNPVLSEDRDNSKSPNYIQKVNLLFVKTKEFTLSTKRRRIKWRKDVQRQRSENLQEKFG